MNIWTRIASIPLRAKLAIGILFAVVAITLLAFLAVTQYTQVVQPTSDALLQALVRERAESLNEYAADIGGITQNTANEPDLIALYATLSTSTGDIEGARIVLRSRFESLMRGYPLIRNIRFVGVQGQVILSAPQNFSTDDRDKTYFQTLSKTPDIQNTVYIGRLSDDANPIIEFVATPNSDTARLGYVVVVLDPTGSADATMASLFKFLRSYNSPVGAINFYLIDSDQHLESPFRVPAKATANTPQVVADLMQQTNTLPHNYTSPITGLPSRGVTAPIARMNRTLVAEAQDADLAGQISQVGRFVSGIVAVWGIAVVILLILWLILENTVVRPVLALRGMATRIAQGRTVEDSLTVPQHDEIGELATSFNTLTSLTRQEFRNLEDRIAQRTRDIEATRDIGQAISSIRDLDALLNRIIELIRERFENIYHAQVFLIEPTRQYAVLRASTGEVGQRLLERGHRLPVGSQSVIGKTTADGQPVVALDTSTSPIHKRNELLPDTRAELALPLRTREGILGALDLQSKRSDAFGESDIRLFQSVADQLSIAIVNAQLFEESRQRLSEIEDLNRRLMGDAWYDYTVTRKRSAASAAGEPWSELQLRAYEAGDMVEQINKDTVTFAIPVSLRGQTIGAVEWSVPRASYNDNTRMLARELTARLAVSADSARLLEQSQRLADRERLVNDITRKLTQQTDVSQVLQIAVRELGQALKVPQTAIRLATGTPSTEHSESRGESPASSQSSE